MGSSFALASLLVLLLAMGIALALVAFGLLWVGRRRASHAQCGSCGYAVAGLEAMRCPECGADLREVGIVTPARSGPVSPAVLGVMLGLAWTMVLPFPAMVVTKLIVDSRPRTYTVSSTFELASPLRGFRSIVIEFAGEGPNATIPAYSRAELREVAEDSGSDRIVPFTLPDMRRADGDGETVDAAFLADWLIPPAEDRTDADLAKAADELMTHIQAGTQRRGIRITSPAIYTSGRATATTTQAPLPGWVIPGLLTPWVVIWLIGVLLIVRRVRRASRMDARAAA